MTLGVALPFLFSDFESVFHLQAALELAIVSWYNTFTAGTDHTDSTDLTEKRSYENNNLY